MTVIVDVPFLLPIIGFICLCWTVQGVDPHSAKANFSLLLLNKTLHETCFACGVCACLQNNAASKCSWLCDSFPSVCLTMNFDEGRMSRIIGTVSLKPLRRVELPSAVSPHQRQNVVPSVYELTCGRILVFPSQVINKLRCSQATLSYITSQKN